MGKGKAATMTGGMAIVEALIANGVDTVFGLPGAQLYALFDALQQRSDQIRTVFVAQWPPGRHIAGHDSAHQSVN
jgi:glyoxylate carboligase